MDIGLKFGFSQMESDDQGGVVGSVRNASNFSEFSTSRPHRHSLIHSLPRCVCMSVHFRAVGSAETPRRNQRFTTECVQWTWTANAQLLAKPRAAKLFLLLLTNKAKLSTTSSCVWSTWERERNTVVPLPPLDVNYYVTSSFFDILYEPRTLPLFVHV